MNIIKKEESKALKFKDLERGDLFTWKDGTMLMIVVQDSICKMGYVYLENSTGHLGWPDDKLSNHSVIKYEATNSLEVKPV